MDLSTNFGKCLDLYLELRLHHCTLSTRIDNKTIERLKKIKTYLQHEEKKDKFYSYDKIINKVLDVYEVYNGIYEEYTKETLENDESFLEYVKIDTHITKSVRNDISLIIEYMKKNNMFNEKMTIPTFIGCMLRDYLYLHPDAKEYVENRNKFMAQKVAINEYKKKARGH